MEYCLHCYNQVHNLNLKETQVILSAPNDPDLCCVCGKIGSVLVRVPNRTPLGWLQCRYWRLRDGRIRG